MKFPIKFCVPTADLTYKTYSLFICKLVSQGYENNISHLSFSLMQNWLFIGVTEYGSVECYDQPSSFLGINEWIKYAHLKDEDFPNLWSAEKLSRYLYGK